MKTIAIVLCIILCGNVFACSYDDGSCQQEAYQKEMIKLQKEQIEQMRISNITKAPGM